MGLVAVLESPEHLAGYATHPAHLEYVYHHHITTVFHFFFKFVAVLFFYVMFLRDDRLIICLCW